MKDNSGNIKQYSAEDIRRYVQDEMSPMEMHAIERAALDDPFLADAIEGYASGITEHGHASVEKSATNLQAAFAERVHGKKKRNLVPVVKMKWWQAAMAASIIITAGIIGYRSYTDRSEELFLSVNEKNNESGVDARKIDSVQPQASAMESTNPDPGATDTILDITKAELPVDNKPTANSRSKQKNENSRDENDQDTKRTTADVAAATNERTLTIIKDVPSTNQKPGAEQKDAANQTDVAAKKPTASQTEFATKKAAASKKANRIDDQTVALNEKATAIEDQEIAVTKQAAEAPMPLKKEEGSGVKKDIGANQQAVTPRSQSGTPPETKLSGKVAGVDFDSRKAATNKQSPLNYFNGQIVTSDNKPLSNAVLKLNNNATVYTTDNNGKFRIASPDSVIEVEASMVGRETTRFRLQKDDEVKNLLMPDAEGALNEVVVIGYGTQRKKDITGSVTVVRREAEPEGGWAFWEKYLQANKDSTLTLNGSAETEVSFQVTTKNKLSQFRVIRSISAKHDQEVIRLIKQGPKWNLRKGKKSTVTITIRF